MIQHRIRNPAKIARTGAIHIDHTKGRHNEESRERLVAALRRPEPVEPEPEPAP